MMRFYYYWKKTIYFQLSAIIFVSMFMFSPFEIAGAEHNFLTGFTHIIQAKGSENYCRCQVNTLSPQVTIHSGWLREIFQQSSFRKLAAGDDRMVKHPVLPEWLNLEELSRIKNLRIEKEVLKNQVLPFADNKKFDVFNFYISYTNKKGDFIGDGLIKIWVFHQARGVCLFCEDTFRYKIKVVIFKPNLPRGLGIKHDGKQIKAGTGISLLWLLLVQEADWQVQKGVIFNADVSSQGAFRNVSDRWSSFLFKARPLFNKEEHEHIGFVIPRLSKKQNRLVNQFLQTKVSFIEQKHHSRFSFAGRIPEKELSALISNLENPVLQAI